MRIFSRMLIPLLGSISLHADAIEPDALNDIYIEAILFVAVFALMSIISFIISRKHAREYAEAETPIGERSLVSINKRDETDDADTVDDKTKRLNELSKMLKEGVLSEDEFRLLEQALKEKR